ncbi:MAG: SAM-dependent methyltransferase [Clostridia bacterium]|nr:SAM-dependent methyltransferase [Clostridia bacterium]
MDKRLQSVAARVRPGRRLADIGTDHAYLPVWLVQQGVCPCAVATDLRRGPAEHARQTVAAAGLADRIDVRVGDGLAPLRPGEADDIVLAGMGGDTIAAILAAASWIRDPALHLVLQPQSRAEKTRAFLLENGFSLLREETVLSAGRRYLIIQAAYTGAAPDPRAWKPYVGILDPAAERPWLEKQARLCDVRQKGLLAAGDPVAAEEAAALAAAIRQYIRGEIA